MSLLPWCRKSDVPPQNCLSQGNMVCGLSYERSHFLPLFIGLDHTTGFRTWAEGASRLGVVCRASCTIYVFWFPQTASWRPTARKTAEGKCLWGAVPYQPISKQTNVNDSTVTCKRIHNRCSSPNHHQQHSSSFVLSHEVSSLCVTEAMNNSYIT